MIFLHRLIPVRDGGVERQRIAVRADAIDLIIDNGEGVPANIEVHGDRYRVEEDFIAVLELTRAWAKLYDHAAKHDIAPADIIGVSHDDSDPEAPVVLQQSATSIRD
ncbi:hypothetical protein HOU02_gp088 [Caulobacter phage CcrBL9]|uniref:Uncharacterized protein n=1 Tax=Caulobacter phage CcrBL9 TaxID=2283270 RepID=A0A385EE36_9CAUD|nr:hypothetical protein HOU02_gp088 [Caulobacter phage CcrBL9]AXQ69112.1 hypothetical protein CcrBL9_gp088 [Caulobacter phage CcrBL9]